MLFLGRTYPFLNESLKDEIIEKLDIQTLASNVGELDIDDAVDVVEDLEESDQEVFLSYISASDRNFELIQPW